MEKLFVIAGATASGKTAAAVALAKKIGGEVVSADSMQVYRGFDIGTAKPTAEERQGIPHHLIDVVEPDEPFSAAMFQELAVDAIRGITARGRIPILAGGTGFYINAVLFGTDFVSEGHEREQELRRRLAELAIEKGADFLHSRLEKADPAAALTIHPNNIKRAARALAYCETTGRLFSGHNAVQKAKNPMFDASFFVLTMNRETLYRRINKRTAAMFEAGLVAEVRKQRAEDRGLAPLLGIGYKETVAFIDGELTKEQAIAGIQQATRNYAKRQETWFRHNSPGGIFIDAEGKTAEEIAEMILRTCSHSPKCRMGTAIFRQSRKR